MRWLIETVVEAAFAQEAYNGLSTSTGWLAPTLRKENDDEEAT